MENKYDQQARVFKALCDSRRLRILELLQGGEKCACVLIEEMDIPQSSLAYHMKILCESGIVVGREDGKWTHYKICSNGRQHAIDLLREITAAADSNASCEKCSN